MMTQENVRLVKVDTHTFDRLARLSVREEQKEFVASNLYSLAEAYATVAEGRFAQPFGVFAGEVPVGFLMIGYDFRDEWEENAMECPEFVKDSYFLWRFMIDKDHQHRGYGKEALKLALDYIRTFPCGAAGCCWLSYEPENEVARRLYRSFGFVEWSGIPKGWDEMPAVLKL